MLIVEFAFALRVDVDADLLEGMSFGRGKESMDAILAD
jgi:hypothetical protein